MNLNNNLNIKPKKVELIELFYDLIYVYAISRLSLLVEQNGNEAFLPSFLRYLIYCLVILQSWLYLTNYANRYCRFRWYEMILISINMVAALYMSNTISVTQLITPRAFNLSMTVMLMCVLILYIIVIMKKEDDIGAAKNTTLILSIICFLYCLAFFLSFKNIGPYPLYLDLSAVILGAFLPFLIKGKFDPSIINFPHLVERLELLTIVSFGDSIVAISQFFDVTNFSFFPSAIFSIVLLLFTCYVIQIHYLVEHMQINRALRMMFSHYFIVIAINMLTISFKFLVINNSDHYFIAFHTVAALAMFFISIYVDSIYYKKGLVFSIKDWLIFVFSIIIGIIVLIIFIEPVWGLIAGCYVIILPNLILLINKRCKNRL